jgi:hypothetical protein
LRDIQLRNVNLLGNHIKKLIRPTQPVNGNLMSRRLFQTRSALFAKSNM